MEREVDNFTLRIPIEINKSIKELSKEIDISQNSLILFFINIGIKILLKLFCVVYVNA